MKEKGAKRMASKAERQGQIPVSVKNSLYRNGMKLKSAIDEIVKIYLAGEKLSNSKNELIWRKGDDIKALALGVYQEAIDKMDKKIYTGSKNSMRYHNRGEFHINPDNRELDASEISGLRGRQRRKIRGLKVPSTKYDSNVMGRRFVPSEFDYFYPNFGYDHSRTGLESAYRALMRKKGLSLDIYDYKNLTDFELVDLLEFLREGVSRR
jgi:hypothetical protein